MLTRRTSEIRDFIIDNISNDNLVSLTAKTFGISRATVYKNIAKLVSDGVVTHDAVRKGRSYSLVTTKHNFIYKISDQLSESRVWMDDIRPLISGPENVIKIWEYCFMEMFNNAIDHSDGTCIGVQVLVDKANTTIGIMDDGVGVFRKIKNTFNLANEHEAILELSKGKLTTNKSKHSGEGIFFASRAVDMFILTSYGISFTHNEKIENDVLFMGKDNVEGTLVGMQLKNNSTRQLVDVFNKFSGDDYGFDKTIIPIELARYGDENLVSRSQAKRVMARVNLFKNVVLNFENVPLIGQAFSDEIFRVFANEHPDIELAYINANPDVENMIKRAKNVKLD